MAYDNQQNNQSRKLSRIIPVWKFILLSVITFGIYELVWSYMNWRLLKDEKKLDISPFWRSFFAPLFTGSLAKQIKKYLEGKNSPCDYSPTFIGISYFILSISWKLSDPYWLIAFFTFLPVLPLVKSMNTYWQKEEQNLPFAKFTWWQIILVILGIILVILLIGGSFLPE